MKISFVSFAAALLAGQAQSIIITEECLGLSIAAFIDCTLETCPAAVDDASPCGTELTTADSCADLDADCTAVMSSCCGACAGSAADLIVCATGGSDGLCYDTATDEPQVTCGASPTDTGKRFLLEEEEEEAAAANRKLELSGFGCLSEATRAYTECVIKTCPGADAACTGSPTADGDTCADLQPFCDYGEKCCPGCQAQLQTLLNCATAQECAIDCGTGSDVESTTPAPAPGPSAANSLTAGTATAAAAVAAIAMI